jgi:dTDP-4-dehydrorhamnose reductase
MEVWGGIECTINRVGDAYFDQLSYDDVYSKPELIERVVGLGIKTMRFPILWERNWPDDSLAPEWAVEKHLQLLQENNINVIAGLVHHGSGPSYANLADPNFPEALARYAGMVAEKFPWITDYTPINEPLTTARFCGLYGLWHPHGRSTSLFLQLLLNECKATILAMRAIRLVNPKARLVFTEDLTKIHGSKEVQAQVDFENKRRWLSIDLICGKVNNTHPLWDYLLSEKVTKTQLDFFIANPCPPELLGFNYYVTSERYLDHQLAHHPVHTHGGNGMITYADIEAVRHPEARLAGVKNLLTEAYHRYQLPMAITEAHLCCGREDQLRWLTSIWSACKELVSDHIPVKAVTFWSLFGAYGWDKLLTREKGSYEPGAFDLSAGFPRPTAISRLISTLSVNKSYVQPLLKRTGWWQSAIDPGKKNRPVLIVGGTGTLGTAFKNACSHRNIDFIAPVRKILDINHLESIEKIIKRYRPWAIINAAGYVNVDAAEDDVEACLLANTVGPANLAKVCQAEQTQFLTFSSDLVLNGDNPTFNLEDHPPKPLNMYGYSKAEAERCILALDPNALVVRTSAFFGPWDRYNFVTVVLESLQKGHSFSALMDVYISATYLPHLTSAALDLLIDREKGIWHLSNIGKVSWYEFAQLVAAKAGYEGSLIKPVSQAELALRAKRPVNSALASSKGMLMPTLSQGLADYFKHVH